MEERKEGVSDDLQILFKTTATIPISTSECERDFSSMNEIITPLRSSLNISTVSALLFVNCVDPSLTDFHPETYVRSWLVKGRNSANDTANRKRKKKIEKYSALWKLL
ncbi:Ribonuclease H-like domain,HAT, C-terminal dimerisation domain [Cinara cedri]|uniref:Ribonuclease H-like domain,HAT, C-terminal dimerisation domain n=1 Tax=Cinara cedri TaxID=506608 RepID=A0A5E4N473_9HEMI|nr:Ribonuclease H-like domain,HAT, C-terminal dimerisation domain [Cinara cedri]